MENIAGVFFAHLLTFPNETDKNHGHLRAPPPVPTPQEIAGLIKGLLVSLNEALLGAYFLGGGVALGGSGPLDYHDQQKLVGGFNPSEKY